MTANPSLGTRPAAPNSAPNSTRSSSACTGIDDRDDVEYILETFQTDTGGLKHNEIKEFGIYRTKKLILDEYDRLAEGGPYKSPLAVPPGQGPRHPAQVVRN